MSLITNKENRFKGKNDSSRLSDTQRAEKIIKNKLHLIESFRKVLVAYTVLIILFLLYNFLRYLFYGNPQVLKIVSQMIFAYCLVTLFIYFVAKRLKKDLEKELKQKEEKNKKEEPNMTLAEGDEDYEYYNS